MSRCGERGDRLTISRRTMLAGSAAAITSGYVARLSSTPLGRYLDGVTARLADAEELRPRSGGAVQTFSVERPSDLLQLDMVFYEFELDTSSSPVSLVATSAANQIYVYFPPQAIGEGVYPLPTSEASEPIPPGTFDPPPVLSVLSGQSWLVFNVPNGTSIPFTTMTVDDLLDWSGWTLLVPPCAIIQPEINGVEPIPPAPTIPTVTQVECPYGLWLAPVVNENTSRDGLVNNSFQTTFVGTTQPATSDGVTECWTATLRYNQVAQIPTIDTPPVLTPLQPLASAVWCRELQMYSDAKGTDTWQNWPSPMANKAYFATPTLTTGVYPPEPVTIPQDE